MTGFFLYSSRENLFLCLNFKIKIKNLNIKKKEMKKKNRNAVLLDSINKLVSVLLVYA